ncbi:MAG TPA: hypothetical protein VD993_09295 [Chitinophagaceae bacterium]|nr:hypothetical protein [Chitinophagaceae bacterium]
MKSFILRNRHAFLAAIALYQLLGGILGIGILWYIYGLEGILATFLVSFFLLGLLLLLIYSGICYFRPSKRHRFFMLSIIMLLLQVFQFRFPGFAFHLYYSPYIAIGINGDLEFLFQLKLITYQVGLWLSREGDFPFRFMISFFPVILLLILDLIRTAKPVDALEGFAEQQPG